MCWVELLTQQAQRVIVDRLRGGDHLAELDQHLDQVSWHGADLVCEIRNAGAAWQANRLTTAARDAHTSERRCLHVVELLTLGALGLATP